MKTTFVVAVLALVLAGNAYSATFSKRTLSDAHLGKGKAELVAQIDFSARIEHFFQVKHHWMIAARHGNCWSHVPWAKTCNRARLTLRKHERLYAIAKARLDRLYPAHPVVSDSGAEFWCIHHYEGAWNANTGNGYFGGLQMDIGFQGTYGPEFLQRWGTADKWPIWAQVVAARRARDGFDGYGARGYGPWPNTARACGLL